MEEIKDVYMVIVPAGVRLTVIKDMYTPDREAYIISSYKNYDKIELSLQGQEVYIKQADK